MLSYELKDHFGLPNGKLFSGIVCIWFNEIWCKSGLTELNLNLCLYSNNQKMFHMNWYEWA